MMLSNIFPFHLKQNKSLDAVVENLQFTYFSKYGYFFPFTGEDNSQVKKNILFSVSLTPKELCPFCNIFITVNFLKALLHSCSFILKICRSTHETIFQWKFAFGINFATKRRKSKRNIQAFSQIINLFLCIIFYLKPRVFSKARQC